MEERNVIVITGASGGMGAAVALRYAAAHTLVLTGTSSKKLDPLVASLPGAGHIAVPVDLGDPDAAEKIGEAARKAGAFKALVHTGGMSPNMGDPLRISTVNLLATMRLLDVFQPMVGPGSVAVLISSISGHFSAGGVDARVNEFFAGGTIERFAEGLDSLGAYGASKRGVIMLAAARASEWGARGGRVVSLSPGLIETPMWAMEMDHNTALMTHMREITPLARVGSPEEIADAVEYLCSARASFITGTDLLVDGGVVAAMTRMRPSEEAQAAIAAS